MPSENSPTSPLDPLHSPGSDTQEQLPLHGPSTLSRLTLSAQDAGPTFRQNQATPQHAMAKTKRRMFSTPLLRRSATASTAAAASAASMIRSNLSTVTKLPTALKRSTTNSAAADGTKAHVDRAPTIPSLSRSSTESSVKQEEPKAVSHHSRMFGIPSLMRIRTGSKDKTHAKPLSSPMATVSGNPLSSPESHSEQSSSKNYNHSETDGDDKEASTPPAQMSAINNASRFVMGMPTMLRRAVSSNHTPPTTTQKKSPDTSANSTPRGEFPEDEQEENDRHSLLVMLQVPEAQRRSQIPLMAAGEAW